MNYPFKKRQGNAITLSFAKKLMMKFGEICYFESDPTLGKLQASYWKMKCVEKLGKLGEHILAEKWYEVYRYHLVRKKWEFVTVSTDFNFNCKGKWYRAEPKKVKQKKIKPIKDPVFEEARFSHEKRLKEKYDRVKYTKIGIPTEFKINQSQKVVIKVPRTSFTISCDAFGHKNASIRLDNGDIISVQYKEGSVGFELC